MNNSVIVVLAAVAIVLLSKSDAGKGPNVLQRDVPDAFKVFAAFPYVVAISDADNDTIFECLTAKRKHFHPEAKTVTYVWSLDNGPGKRKHVGFHCTTGATPDAANCTVGKGLPSYCKLIYDSNDYDSNKVEVAHIIWSDYKDCTVTEVPHFGDQCTLWVSKEVEDLVPLYCLEQFHDVCGVVVPLHDSDLCEDDENDEEDEDD